MVKKNNAMYFNKNLEEVQYFDPKNTAADIFFNFFYNKYFLDNAEIKFNNNSINFIKKIEIENEINEINILFQESPIKLKKIEILNSEGETSFSIINPNYNPDLDEKMFSLVNPLAG